MTCTRLTAITLAIAFVTGCDLKAPASEELTSRIEAIERRFDAHARECGQKIDEVLAHGKVETERDERERQARTRFMEVSALIAGGKMSEAKTRLAAFMKTFAGTDTARQALRFQHELDVIGKSAPQSYEIEKWFQGEQEIDFASDKTTLFVFFELWCPHCRREVPRLQQLYESSRDQNLQIVGLTQLTRGTTEETLGEFLEENKVGYPTAKDSGSIRRFFNVSGIPAAAVVKGGKVVWRGHPARLNEEVLKS